MTDQELAELAKGAEGLGEERRRELRARLPRWGDLYDLNGIVEGLRCARDLLGEEGRPSAALGELSAVAAAELLRGRAEVAKVRAMPSLPPEVGEAAALDAIISAGLRAGKPLPEIMQEVDERQRQTRGAARNGIPQPGRA